MSQGSSLTPERWAAIGTGKQILNIASEMLRGMELLRAADRAYLRSSYERVFGLVDLTVAVNDRPAFRRELLRWREVVAELYLRESPDPATHALALRTLFEMHPQSQGQVALMGL